MLTRFNALTASLILGLICGLWHLPLHFIEGTVQYGIPVYQFFLQQMLLAILYTWLYNHVQGSLLAIVVFHMWQDVTEYLVPLGLYEGAADGLIVSAAVNWIVAAVLAAGWVKQALSQRRKYEPAARIL